MRRAHNWCDERFVIVKLPKLLRILTDSIINIFMRSVWIPGASELNMARFGFCGKCFSLRLQRKRQVHWIFHKRTWKKRLAVFRRMIELRSNVSLDIGIDFCVKDVILWKMEQTFAWNSDFWIGSRFEFRPFTARNSISLINDEQKANNNYYFFPGIFLFIQPSCSI